MNLNYIKKIYGKWLQALTSTLGIDAAKTIDARLRFHKKINLKNPQKLSEKLCWIELHDQSPLAPICTDKYAVRQYVTDKGYPDILIPVLHPAVEHFEQIDFASLPNQFVVKATHGCKMNYIVKDKRLIDLTDCKKEVNNWLSTTYGTFSLEPHYLGIPHRIYVEQFIENIGGLIDYKFHCINGQPKFVLTVSERESKHSRMEAKLNLYDMDWNPIHELKRNGNEVPNDKEILMPASFEKMKEVASTLSQDFKFVRVDLYEVDGKVKFGELTFSPANCLFPNFSEKFDEEMGKLLSL